MPVADRQDGREQSDDVSAETSSAPAEPESVELEVAAEAAGPGADTGTGVDLITVRRLWPDVLDVVKGMRRFTWTLLSHNAQVAGLEEGRLTLAMVNAGARDSFLRGGSDEIVREALIQVLGVDWKVDAIVDPSTEPVEGKSKQAAPSAGPADAADSAPGAAPQRPKTSRRAAAMAAVAEAAPAAAGPEDVPSADDADADDTGLTHHDLLARELGAKVIGEYDAS